MRILVPLTLLDACLVRAIVLFLAAPLVDISIFQPGAASDGRAAASGCCFQRSALLFRSALRSALDGLAELLEWQESNGSSWKRLLAGVPDVIGQMFS